MSFVIKINDRFLNRKIEYFNNFSLNLVFNSVASTYGIDFYFDPFNREHKELGVPGHYHEMTVEFNGEQLLKGVLLNKKFTHSTSQTMASWGGYALPGIIEDVTIPTSSYPLQMTGLTLNQIASRLLNPFKRNYGLEYVVDPAVASRMNKTFKNATASETQTPKDFLTQLASQKNIIITHDEFGRLLFTEAKTDVDPVLTIDGTKEMPVGTSYEFSFDGQGMHSRIYMQKQASADGGNVGAGNIRNPYVIGSVFRPIVKTQSSGDDNDTSLALRRALGNELKGMKLTIQTDRWIVDGKILKPNNIIEIIDPHLFIYRKERFFIESISYTGDQTKTVATLNCVLPEVYSEDKVVSIYRGINLEPIPHDE